MMSSDNDCTCTGLLAGSDLVDLSETLTLVGDLELLGEIVVSDGAGVYDRVGGQDVL